MKSQKENLEKLFHLIKENPDLPILPMVDSEIVAEDGYSRWTASWGNAYVGEYIIGNEGVYFREDNDMYEVERTLDEFIDDGVFNGMSNDEEKKAYGKLPWIKAIIVNIDLPEV